jgi:outer membrane protein OmpA-like peptidoglycan-associated protein
MKAEFILNKHAVLLTFGTIALATMASCGGAPPTDELLSARRAYKQAERSQARELVPDQLLTAKQALDEAEQAHDDQPGSMEEKTRSYIAERKARLAVSLANIRASRENITSSNRAYTEALESDRVRTRSDLTKTKGKLNKSQEDLAKSHEDLERERKAREAAEKKAAQALASLEEIAKVKEESRGMVITLSGAVLFKSNKADLLPIATEQLTKVAEALKEQDETKTIVVEGHTDSRGSERANLKLSQDRADSVRAFLISQGINANRVVAIGKGKSQPIADNSSAEGRANNRRVEIVVSDKKQQR